MMGKRRLKPGVPAVAVALALCGLLISVGCAKYNTYYNASRAFDSAEKIREERIERGEDPTEPTSQQLGGYQRAVKKSQLVLDDYPGSGLTDDALFLMAKSYNRMNSYRMSVGKFDLLFKNYPATEYLEESYYLQALNYMYIGDMQSSNDYLQNLSTQFPDSRFQSETQRVSANNSFELEQWEEARAGFERYLEVYPDSEYGEEITYRLAVCHWELENYPEAEARLLEVLAKSEAKEEIFDAKLMLSRCLIRMDRADEADAILSDIETEAELYSAQGDVVLAQAANLVRRDKASDAVPLLENIPREWLNPTLSARLNEMLGIIYFQQWRLNDASKLLREAARNPQVLDDPDRVKSYAKALNQYLAAEQRLDSAGEEIVPSLKLVMANSLLLTLGKPRMALENYLDAAAARNDTISSVRGFYGAHLVYRDYLDLPDSAAVMADSIQIRHPDSAHAYLLADDSGERDLYTILVEESGIAAAERNRMNATLEASARVAAVREQEASGMAEAALETPEYAPGVEPGDQTRVPAAAGASAAADSVAALSPSDDLPLTAGSDSLTVPAGEAPAALVPGTALPDSAAAQPDSAAVQPEVQDEPAAKPVEEPEDKQPQKKDWSDLLR